MVTDRNDDYAAVLRRALANAGESDGFVLQQLIDTFQPYVGDEPAQARERTMMLGGCRNCGFRFPAAAMPCELSRFGLALLRHCQCPRCYCTDIDVASE